MERLISLGRQNRIELLILVIIILLGAFFRFYKIDGYATFLGDEGRDALIVKRMIVDHRFTLLGPTISFGNLYLGPIYYYFMIFPLWLFKLNPVGPAVMVAGFGTASILLVWLVSRTFFNKISALVASSLYAVSPLVVIHTRSSWNPNPMPFFALLVIFGLYKTISKNDGRWLGLVGLCLGIALQLHYIAIAFIISAVLITIIQKPKIRYYWYLWGIGFFLLALSPQIAFEIRHDFINLKAMINLILQKREFASVPKVGLDVLSPVPVFFRLFTRLVATRDQIVGMLLGVFSIIVVGYSLAKEVKKSSKGLTLLIEWIVFGILGISLYRGQLHDHYLGFLFPAPFILLGYCFSKIWAKNGKLIKLCLSLALMILLFMNTQKQDVLSGVGPNFQIQRTKAVARTIATDAGDRNFNIAISSPTGDFLGSNYRYFLEIYGKKPKEYNRSGFGDIDTLYVIVDGGLAQMEGLNLWEVGTFGSAKLTQVWKYDFQISVYRLDKK